MKNEIKELLEHIEILDNTDYILHSDKAKALLDYITNLQTIEQQYGAILGENAELKNTIINLQKELVKWRKSDKVLEILKNNLDEEVGYYFRKYKEADKKIEKTINNINITIELIKQQPTEDDTWILDRLNSFKYLLQGDDKE